MRRLIAISAAVLAFGLLPLDSFAQQASLATPVCNAEFAQLLVGQQVAESKPVTDSAKRIKILIRSADFLWPFDEPASRSYFTEAFKLANERFKEKGFESTRSGNKDSAVIIQHPDQRMEVVRAIAKRDGSWAAKLAEQVLADIDPGKERSEFDKTRELSDLLTLASQSAKTNPALSRQILARVMRYPLFNAWYWTFYSLYSQDPGMAATIYADALRTYRNETPRRLLYLSAFPFGTERIIGPEKHQLGTSLPENFAASPQLQLQFLDVFFSRVAAYANDPAEMNRAAEAGQLPEAAYMVAALRELEPIIVSQFPDLLGRFGEARAQAQSILTEAGRKALDDREKQSADIGQTFEERLKALEEAEGQGKLTDFMIISLVTRTVRSDEEFEKIKPWLDKIKEEKPRSETVNYYWFKRAKLAIEQKRYDDAEKFSLKVPEIEHRAILTFDLARIQAKNVNDTAAMFETLNRLSKLSRSADNSVSKAQILLGLANMYEPINHSTAMDELSEAIRVTNSMKEPDVFKTNVMRQIVGKGFGFFASFATPGYDLEKTFVELSKKDFEMSLGQAKALDDRYLRTLAVIAVASNCAKNVKAPEKARPKEAQ